MMYFQIFNFMKSKYCLTLFVTCTFSFFIWSCDEESTTSTELFAPYIYIETGDNIIAPPSGFSSFYKKYLNAGGIPVTGSDNVRDEALIRVRHTILNMLAKRPDVLNQMIIHRLRVAIVADEEVTSDLPEYADVEDKNSFNSRARGYGGSESEPFVTVSEENVMRDGSAGPVRQDDWRTMDVFVHEFGHGIHQIGMTYAEPEFEKKLTEQYESSLAKGLWTDTYAGTNIYEFFAECTGAWFDVKTEGPAVGDGTNSNINTRAELKAYDPEMYAMLASIYPDSKWRPTPLNLSRGKAANEYLAPKHSICSHSHR